ncbi:Hpt protein [uncultured Desulfatiglans sp.]|nr:Hpt protein [uncultured Desulfatiglans sp.]
MYKPYKAYMEADIHTSSPLKLVLMLYEGAITFLNKAVQYSEAGDIKNKNIYANKARDIVMELNNALNIDQGGELAQGLRRIYLFMNRHLIQANWRNDVRGLEEVRQMLSNLLEGWENAYLQVRGNGDAPRLHATGLQV